MTTYEYELSRGSYVIWRVVPSILGPTIPATRMLVGYARNVPEVLSFYADATEAK